MAQVEVSPGRIPRGRRGVLGGRRRSHCGLGPRRAGAADTTDVTGSADLLARRLAMPPTGRAAQRPERSGPQPRSAPDLRACMAAPGGESSANSRHMTEKRTTSADGRRRP
jgi:hypothetical protein